MTSSILELSNISKKYISRKGVFGKSTLVSAVDSVSLSIERGQTLGLVGESGSGKSTTGRVALGIETPNSGEVTFESKLLPKPDTSAWRRARAQMQMIFQDPLGALDRRLPIIVQVRDPLNIHRIGNKEERREKAEAILNAVGLTKEHWQRFPHELSGGQRQRAVIARALVTEPTLLVCDEPVSALDVSIQAQVVNLLMDLQKRLGLSLLFISHDLKVVRHVSHQIAVMYLGRIVESGPADLIVSAPAHPYTKALVSAAPVPGQLNGERVVLRGEPPNPAARPTGCAFHPRCLLAREQCKTADPEPTQLADGRVVTCHAANPTNEKLGGWK